MDKWIKVMLFIVLFVIVAPMATCAGCTCLTVGAGAYHKAKVSR